MSKKNCKALIQHFDATMDVKSMAGSFQVKDAFITASDLICIIGNNAFGAIIHFLYKSLGVAPVSGIVLCRVYADGTKSMGCMDWHMHENIPGFKEGTLAIALNADEDVTGGGLYYLRHNDPFKAKRSQGKGYAHPYNILHSSVERYKGARYSLYIHVNQCAEPKTKDLIKGYYNIE